MEKILFQAFFCAFPSPTRINYCMGNNQVRAVGFKLLADGEGREDARIFCECASELKKLFVAAFMCVQEANYWLLLQSFNCK